MGKVVLKWTVVYSRFSTGEGPKCGCILKGDVLGWLIQYSLYSPAVAIFITGMLRTQ